MAAYHDGPPAPLLGGVALLERAVTYSLGRLHGVDPTGLHRPTPCERWDLGDLLVHLNDSLLALTEAAQVGRVDAAPDLGVPASGDLVAAVRDQARRLLGTWATGQIADTDVAVDAPLDPGPAGPIDPAPDPPASLSTGIVAGAGALEIAVHGWDVGVASGHRHPIPSTLAGELYDLARLLVSDADRPVRFAARVPQPIGAGPADRLLGFLGRHP